MRDKSGLHALLLGVAVVLIVVLCGLSRPGPSYSATSYTVQPGDTLDGLAARFGVTEDWRVWRERMKEENGMDASGLLAGETITVLVGTLAE